MDYLKTLGSAAVSTLVQKSGLNLPFSLGLKVTTLDGICTLYDGIKRDDSSPVSVFEYNFSDQTKSSTKLLATNALRKLRATRHPDILKFMDAVETDNNIYIMTERIRPLQNALQEWSSRGVREREDWLMWGLHRISVALAFINDSCTSTHGKLCTNAVFISPSGEWKLGGFELFSSPKGDAQNLYTLGGQFPGSSSWASPETKKGGWSVLKDFDPAVADAYALGLLLYSVFNPSHPLPATASPPHPPPTPASCGSIPTAVFPSFKKLLNPNPKGRMTAKAFLDIGMSDTGFFATNKLVKVCLELDHFSLGSEAEKNTFLRALKDSASSFPHEFTLHHVLPSLVSALEFGGTSAATILPLVLQFGASVSPEEYPHIILAPLIKLFASPDRGTRIALLDHLGEYVDRLDKKTVSDKIFPHLATGFTDTVAIIREGTIKSIILLAPKLNDRILNNDLLRFLAKMQTDPEASIRTNTCILIGRLGPTLGYHTKRKVLVPAFSRALKDTFVHARVAGLMAFMATIDCFDVEDVANKVIPNIAFAMVDKERLVRDQAFKAVELFVKKLESHAAMMPETALSDPSDVSRIPAPEQTTIVNSAAGAAGALAGWAISSLSKKLITSDLQSPMAIGTGTSNMTRPISAPLPTGNDLDPSPTISIPKAVSATATPLSSPLQSISRTKGMQLGVKVSSNIAATVLAEDWTEGIVGSNVGDNPWKGDDLIDIHADQDDWGSFESAPPIILEPKPVGVGFNISDTDKSTLSHETSKVNTYSNLPSRAATPNSPIQVLNSTQWDGSEALTTLSSTLSSPASMTKEQKAVEMARRKEERKQRIALLKEQKKNTVRP